MTDNNNKDQSSVKGRKANIPTGFVIKYSNPNSCDLERMKRIKTIMAIMIAEDIKRDLNRG